jgi:hypothetical protein
VGLQVEIPAGDADCRFPAGEVLLERALGQCVQWRLALHAEPQDARVPYLAALLDGGPLQAKPLLGDSPLGEPSTVVGMRWERGRSDMLVVDTIATTLAAAPSPAPDPDPFTPRWRVHTGVQNLLKLAQKLAHVATLPNWVKSQLEKVKFTPDDFTSVIQDGLSDWAFLGHILDQYGMLGAEAAMKPLVLVGSVEEAPGKWLVTYGSKAAWDSMGETSNRKIKPEDGALESILFGERHGVVPVATRLWRHRPFTSDAWTAWSGKDLPVFAGSNSTFVHRLVDRLWHKDAKGEKIEWSTELSPLPEGAVVAGPEPPVQLRPWLRIGEVSEVQATGPYIKAKLEGFESGSETVQARLQTPYGGTNGKRGLHLVPESGTKVLLSWTGRFHEPVLVVGNVRAEATEFNHPSLWLEALATNQYADLTVKQIGKTTVESDLQMEFQKATTMTSTGALKLTGKDTTDLESEKAFKLTAKDATTLESTKAFKIDAKDTTDVTSTGALTLKSNADAKLGGQNASVEGQQAATVKGNSQVELSATGQTTVKGNPVMIN